MRQMVATLFQRLCQDNSELRVELHTCLSGEQAIRQALCRNQIFNPTSMCAYANVLTRALSLCFENSTRAIDPSKNQPNRLRFDRAREFSSLAPTSQLTG
jgi:hypothetical protein